MSIPLSGGEAFRGECGSGRNWARDGGEEGGSG